jgi:hypothetical protein
VEVITGLEILILFMVFSSIKCMDFREKLLGFVFILGFYGIYAGERDTFSLEIFYFLILIGMVHLRI